MKKYFSRDHISSVWHARYPYAVDGIIFMPLKQKYTIKATNVLKWKPESKNSIDIYIRLNRVKVIIGYVSSM